MKIRNIIYAVAAMTFAACSSENLDTPQVPLTINATIDGVATRRSDVYDFGIDDVIGVYAGDAKNYKFVHEMESSILFEPSEDAYKIYISSDNMPVKAYYPYNKDGSMSITTSSQTGTGITDYLYGEGTASAIDGKAHLVFHHLMCEITLKFSLGEGYSGSYVINKTGSVTIDGIKTEGSYTAPNDKIDLSSDSGETITLNGGETLDMDATMKLRIIPQTLESKSFTLTVTYDGNEYAATVPVKDGELKANKNYIYNVKIDKEKLTVSSSSAISAWDEKKSDDAVDVVYSGDVTSTAVVTTDHGD
jgi:hypothetical protein